MNVRNVLFSIYLLMQPWRSFRPRQLHWSARSTSGMQNKLKKKKRNNSCSSHQWPYILDLWHYGSVCGWRKCEVADASFNIISGISDGKRLFQGFKVSYAYLQIMFCCLNAVCRVTGGILSYEYRRPSQAVTEYDCTHGWAIKQGDSERFCSFFFFLF